MNFIHGVIIAVGLLVAANLAMISTDLEGGGAADYAKEPAIPDMMEKESAETPAPMAKAVLDAMAPDAAKEPPA